MRTVKIVIEVPCYPNIKDEVRLREEKELMTLIDKYKNGDLIIDFGCGTSYYTSSNAVGIDLDRELLSKADLEHKVLASYTHAPFREEMFDAVIMCHSLEHTNMPEKPLSEAYRILKPKGIIGISVPNMKGLHALFRLVFQDILKCIAPDHLTAFTPRRLKEYLHSSGFKIVKEAGDIVYFPLMKKFKMMKLGYFLTKIIPKFSNVYIVIARKIGDMKK